MDIPREGYPEGWESDFTLILAFQGVRRNSVGGREPAPGVQCDLDCCAKQAEYTGLPSSMS